MTGRHELTDEYAHQATYDTKLLMTSNRSIESPTYAINVLIAERGPPEVIYSDRESSIVSMAK